MMDNEIKKNHLKQLADYRKTILKNPPLRNLFLELTVRCNSNCIHCGSRCGESNDFLELSTEQYKKILDEVKSDFDISKIKLDITGGEPLLRKDFFEIMSYANELGYQWGMTTNATLIDDTIAEKLHECGMKTVAVSIDGTEKTHDKLRGLNGAYALAMNGIRALVDCNKFQHVQITTVLNHQNICELPTLFNDIMQTGVRSWRVINIEPIGRAKDHPELLLTPEEYIYLFNFIKEKRRQGYNILYGCSHFLGIDLEREVREWYFLCTAGLYVASITSSGDIVACLDIEKRPELIQGNILKDRLKDVWETKFKIFRKDLSDLNEKCRNCPDCEFCNGGAHHSWNYDTNEQNICFKGILF